MKNKLSRVTVYHIKGGVGKTRIALNLALTLDFGVITNDVYSVVKNVLPASRHKILNAGQPLPQIPPEIPIVFDLGGFADERAIEALRQSQFVLTPLLSEKEDLQTVLDFINEIQKYNENIIIIVNKTKKGEFPNVKKVCQNFYPKTPVFEIKESKVMSLVVKHKLSIKQIARQNKLHKRHYDKVAEQFDAIIKYMRTMTKIQNKFQEITELGGKYGK